MLTFLLGRLRWTPTDVWAATPREIAAAFPRAAAAPMGAAELRNLMKRFPD